MSLEHLVFHDSWQENLLEDLLISFGKRVSGMFSSTCTKPARKQQGRGTGGSAVSIEGHSGNQGRTKLGESHLLSFFQPDASTLLSLQSQMQIPAQEASSQWSWKK